MRHFCQMKETIGMAILLLEQIASLFIIMISGYAAVKLVLLKSEHSKVLTVLSVYIILPCVIITSFQIRLTDQILSGFMLALAAAVLIHILLLVCVKLIGNLFHLNEIERGSLIYHFGKSTTPDQLDQPWVNCLYLFDAEYTV